MHPLFIQIARLEKTAKYFTWANKGLRSHSQLSEHLKKKLDATTNNLITNGKSRIFIAVKNINWEKAALVDTWKNIADFEHWDWGDTYDQHSANWYNEKKLKFNTELLARVAQSHKKKPFTHFFSYLSGRWLYPDTIKKINALGIITINFSFDDAHRFWGKKKQGIWTGVASIAKFFDLNVTAQQESDQVKYSLVGARSIYVPPGGNAQAFNIQHDNKKKCFVSFVGQNYGARSAFINYLRENNIEVCTFGLGWPEGPVTHSQMLDIYSSSFVVLGFGYTGTSYNPTKTALKGRDFEIPFTGTAYLTSFNKDLADHFTENEEMLFYRSKEDALKLLQSYMDTPEKLISIGENGKQKALANHQWEDRWKFILKYIHDSIKQP